MTDRNLNEAQHALLDRLSEFAIVVGWLEDPKFGRGPIVEFLSGEFKFANYTGKLRKLPGA